MVGTFSLKFKIIKWTSSYVGIGRYHFTRACFIGFYLEEDLDVRKKITSLTKEVGTYYLYLY